MRTTGFLCLGGTEIANDARTTHYFRSLGGIPGLTLGAECPCQAYDAGYDTPQGDPAPWYEPTRPESAEFYGFYLSNGQLTTPTQRTVTPVAGVGGVASSLRLGARTMVCDGILLAASPAGMSYGERWLTEALRGTGCSEESPADDALILPACPGDTAYYDGAFRTLVDVGLSEGPAFQGLQDLPECHLQQATFAITSAKPWLYHPPTRVIDDLSLGTTRHGSLTTPTWMGDGTFRVEIENKGDTPASGLRIRGRTSLSGECPPTSPATSVPDCFNYYLTENLNPGDKLVIDGARRQALWYDASCKNPTSALSHLTWDGPWRWPDAGICTTVCLTLSISAGDASATVDTYLREL